MADEPVKSCAPIHCPPFEEVTIDVTSTSVLDQYAARAYRAYGQFTDNKNFMGNEMPRWEDLPEKIRGAWHATVQHLIDDLGVDRDRIGVYRD